MDIHHIRGDGVEYVYENDVAIEFDEGFANGVREIVAMAQSEAYADEIRELMRSLHPVHLGGTYMHTATKPGGRFLLATMNGSMGYWVGAGESCSDL